MTLKLVITTNGDGDVFELVLKNLSYTVGRHPDNDLRINEDYISGYHAEITRKPNGDYDVTDLESSNGTFLSGRRVSGKEGLKAGDIIKLGILKVTVVEHIETSPKIVPLQDRPSFVRKDDSNTAAIAVERKTGNVAAMDVISARGETPDTLINGASGEELKDLGIRLETEKLLVAQLREEIEAGTIQVTSLEIEIESLRKELTSGSEQNKLLAGEVQAKEELQVELAAVTSAKDQSINSLISEIKALNDALNAKGEALIAMAKVAAEIPTLTEEIIVLKSERDETRLLAENEGKERSKVERAFSEKSVAFESQRMDLSGLQAKFDALRVDSEQRKSDLIGELKSVKSAAENERAGLESFLLEARGELDTLRSELAARMTATDTQTAAATKEKRTLVDELESARTLAANECDTLEHKLKAQGKALEEQQLEMHSLLAKMDVLAAHAEIEKSELTRELEFSKSLPMALEEKLSNLQGIFSRERKDWAEEINLLEKENTNLSKSLESIEVHSAKQSEQLARLKASLQEMDKAVRAGSGEAKKGESITQELAALKQELGLARDALESATQRERKFLEESGVTNRRIEHWSLG